MDRAELSNVMVEDLQTLRHLRFGIHRFGFGVSMRIRILFDGILVASLEVKGRNADGSNLLSIPSQTKHQSNNGSGAYNLATGEPHNMLITGHGPSEEDPISPELIKLGPPLLGDEPHDSFPKFTHPLTPFSAVKAAICRPPFGARGKLVQHIGSAFDQPVSDRVRR